MPYLSFQGLGPLTSFCASGCLCRSTQIKTYSWDNAQVLLVGNKCDMEDERVVSSERGRQLADHLGEYPAGLQPRTPTHPTGQGISLKPGGSHL